MRPRRHRSAALLACAIAALTAGGCSSGRPNGAAREGLYENVAGIDYNVFITRELNLRDAEDRAYYRGPEAPPGFALSGSSMTRPFTRSKFSIPLRKSRNTSK